MSHQDYRDEIERLQEQLAAEDPSALLSEVREVQARATALRTEAEACESANDSMARNVTARVRRLQAGVQTTLEQDDAARWAKDRQLETQLCEFIENCHAQRREILANIALQRREIAATAEELRVGYVLKKPDHQVLYPKRNITFERITARAEAPQKDDEVVELEAVNGDLEHELDALRNEHAELLTEHQRAAAEATLQQKDNKRKIEALKGHIRRTTNVARSQRRQCDDLRHQNASIVAGCAVLFSQVNSKYYGIQGGPKSIRIREQQQRRVTNKRLLQLEAAAKHEVATTANASPAKAAEGTSPAVHVA